MAANAALDELGEDPINPDLTLHGLRHTCASVLLYLGEDAGHVADQLGHADAGFTYSRYRKKMRRIPGEAERIQNLVFGQPVADTFIRHSLPAPAATRGVRAPD